MSIVSTDTLPLEGPRSEAVYVHPSSFVDAGAQVGGGTIVWHFCHLMPDSRIGSFCHIGQNVVIQSRAVLGNGCRVLNNVTLFSGVECADDVFLGPCCTFTNIPNPRAFISRKSEFRTTHVEQGASIGANATILCGIRIGAYALVGAGSVVLYSVAPYALVAGNPARQIGWVSREGHRLCFDDKGVAFCAVEGRHYLLREGQVCIADE